MINKKQTIGQRIKELRELKGLTQSQLGSLVGASDKTISKWEKDKSEPESNVLVKFAEIFNVSLDFLLAGNVPDIKTDTISKIELACREDNIALLNNVDLEAFDDKGKSIDYYAQKYKAKNISRFLFDMKVDKEVKEEKTRKIYNILAIPKDLEGEENLILLPREGRHNMVAEECAKYERRGYHNFKVVRKIGVNENIEKDYQYFFAKFLNDKGEEKIVFSTSILDDMESGILQFAIWYDKTYNKDQPFDNKYLPDSYPLLGCEFQACYYIKPSVLKEFMDMLAELKIKDWENRHWGTAIHSLFYVLKEEPKDDNLACHKYYVAPGRENYAKFVKGIQKLFLETLPTSDYRKFVKNFDTEYIPYYRYNLSLTESRELFKKIEEEMENIKQKKFVNL